MEKCRPVVPLCRDAPGAASRCCARCEELTQRLGLLAPSKGDEYRRGNWYMNWWMANTHCDVEHVAQLVSDHFAFPDDDDDEHGLCDRFDDDDVGLNIESGARVVAGEGAASFDVFAKNRAAQRCRYEPSTWEREWRSEVALLQSDDSEWLGGCESMRASNDRVHRWVDGLRRDLDEPGPSSSLALDTDVFSGWLCGDSDTLKFDPIEPLVGHLRDPRFHCVGPHRDTIDLLFSTSYLLLQDQRAHPPKRAPDILTLLHIYPLHIEDQTAYKRKALQERFSRRESIGRQKLSLSKKEKEKRRESFVVFFSLQIEDICDT